MKLFILHLVLHIYFVNCDYNINDDVLFGIQWKEEDIMENAPKGITILSKDKESFHCLLPRNVKDKFDHSFDRTYDGPSEAELLKPLFTNKLCAVKIESYWSYEICHGRYVRQFHEDNVQGKQTALQEYSLGQFEVTEQLESSSPPHDREHVELPTVTINSVNFPYYRVNMTGGTKCDLIGEYRSISVLYICQPDGRGEIYEVHEVRTCHYQAIVFTRLLCAHPGYKVTDNHVNEIACYSMTGLNDMPSSLALLQDEINNEVNSISTLDGLFNEHLNVGSQIKVEAYKENGVIVYRIKALGKTSEPSGEDKEQPEVGETPSKAVAGGGVPPEEAKAAPVTGQSPSTALLHRFMSGKFCVDGGEGWWRHRVCYGRKVSQYHLEMHLETAEVVLGLWREDAHRLWLARNEDKRPSLPAEDRTEIYHYFSEGAFCEEVKARRHAVLRIRCLKDNSSSILISFLEPRTCSYIITIESSLFCSMVREADEDGLVRPKEE